MSDKPIDAASRMLISWKAILAAIDGGAPTTGTIPCPICGGTLAYAQANHANKHLRAKCSTEGCQTWMQ